MYVFLVGKIATFSLTGSKRCEYEPISKHGISVKWAQRHFALPHFYEDLTHEL